VGVISLLVRGVGAIEHSNLPPVWRLDVVAAAGIGEKAAPLFGLGVLVGAALLFRVWRLSALAYRPGPIQVADLVDARSADGSSGPCADDVSARLRAALPSMNVGVPTALPVPAHGDEIAVVDAPDTAKWFMSVAQVVLRLWPRTAYRASGTIHTRDAGDGVEIGIAIEVHRVGRSRSTSRIHWGTDVDDVIDSAAATIGSFVLASSHQRLNEPWRCWKGLSQKPELLKKFNRAQELTAQRRFDEALGVLHDILELDRESPMVRTELGQVFEHLGLWLVALQAHHQAWVLARAQNSIRIQGVAAYRLAIVLGTFHAYAEDWHGARPDGPTEDQKVGPKRLAERRALRKQILPWLELLAEGQPGVGKRRVSTCAKPVDADWPTFRGAALAVVDELRGFGPLERRWAFRGAMSRRGIDVLNVWLIARHPPESMSADRLVEECERLLDRRLVGWRRSGRIEAVADDAIDIASPTGFRRHRRSLQPDRRWGFHVPAGQRRARWQDRYNVACTYSVYCEARKVRLKTELPLPECGFLASRGVDQLRLAILDPRSDFLADARSWFLDEDPDLAELREDDAFKRLRAEYFPARRVPKERPSRQEVHDAQANAHLGYLVREVARRREDWWHTAEAPRPAITVHELRRRARMERRAWSLLGELLANPRHWQTRLEFREELLKGLGELTVELRTYEQLPDELVHKPETTTWSDLNIPVDDVRDHFRARIQDELHLLEAVIDRLGAFDAGTRRPKRDSLPSAFARDRAAAWQQVASAFESPWSEDWKKMRTAVPPVDDLLPVALRDLLHR
jgi:hypothetical protein